MKTKIIGILIVTLFLTSGFTSFIGDSIDKEKKELNIVENVEYETQSGLDISEDNNQVDTFLTTTMTALDFEITKPKQGYLYINDKEIAEIGMTIAIGQLTIEVNGDEYIQGVDIFINDELKFTDYTNPYSRIWNERCFGRRTIKAVEINEFTEAAEDEISLLALNMQRKTPHIVINEIMADPEDDDPGNEWIELYNPGNSVNINGWTLSNADGNAIATLPSWTIPNDAYLVVHFGNGINDDDFSDGNGTYHTAINQEVLDNVCDESALFNGNPNHNNIVDFISYCYQGTYSPGIAYQYANEAGIWNKDEFFDPSIAPLPIGSRISSSDEGNTIGRDAYSNDTNTPQDWDTYGGKDAFNPSPTACNFDIFGIMEKKLGTNEEQLHTASVAEEKKWTVMVYMAGDNNLEEEMMWQLNQLEEIGTDNNMNIVFLIDGKNKINETYFDQDGNLQTRNLGKTFMGLLMKDNNTGYIDWPGGPGGNKRVQLSSIVNAYVRDIDQCCIGEQNTGTPELLTAFINYAIAEAPAEKYVLILGGHGAGWKGLLPDNTDEDRLYMHELKTALNNANLLTFDIVGFDLCFMAMVEVGYQIRNTVDIMVASQEVDRAWDYKDIFGHLQRNPDISSEALASYMVDSYYNFRPGWLCRTLSAIRLGFDFNDLVNKIDEFGKNLKEGMEDWGDTENQQKAVHNNPYDNCQMDVRNILSGLTNKEFFVDHNFKDLYVIIEKIGNHPGIFNDYKKPYQNILNLLDNGDIIINEKHGGGHDGVHGLSLYFPDHQVNRYRVFTCRGWRTKNPFDYPSPSRLIDDNSSLAIYAEDFTIDWGKVPYYGDPPHPWPQTPDLLFRKDTMWDEFLHRYYKPCADAGPNLRVNSTCGTPVIVVFDGRGSSSADDDRIVHSYIWDFNADINSDDGDWDRDGKVESNDDNDSYGPVVSGLFTPGVYEITLTVWDDHHTLDMRNYNLTNDHPNEHWKTDQEKCILTVLKVCDDEPPTVEISTPIDGEVIEDETITVHGNASDNGRIVEMGYILVWGEGLEEYNWSIDNLSDFHFWFDLDLYPGENTITVYAEDAGDLRGEDTVTVYQGETEDTTPPITTATFDPELRVVTLTAYDPPHGDDPISGVCATYYKIDGGSTQVYYEPFTIPYEGSHLVAYWSEDCAGNIEDPNEEIFG